jgi:hypothetical protein
LFFHDELASGVVPHHFPSGFYFQFGDVLPEFLDLSFEAFDLLLVLAVVELSLTGYLIDVFPVVTELSIVDFTVLYDDVVYFCVELEEAFLDIIDTL